MVQSMMNRKGVTALRAAHSPVLVSVWRISLSGHPFAAAPTARVHVHFAPAASVTRLGLVTGDTAMLCR